MQAYCVKCRTKRAMLNARPIVMKNGKPATQGICPVCGTKMFRIGRQIIASGRGTARILWTREPTHHRIEILKRLGLDESHFASPWGRLSADYREKLAGYYKGGLGRKTPREEIPKPNRRVKYPEPEKLLYR